MGVTIHIRNKKERVPERITHIAFSDESHQNIGQWGGIAMVSLPLVYLDYFNESINKILLTSNISEFKWQKLRTAKYREGIIKIIDFTVKNIRQNKFRVDVLVWDKNDSRHKVIGRSDTKNLQRMYYHLLRNVMQRRWPDNTRWELRPDENSCLNWETLSDYLFKGSAIAIPPSLYRDFIYVKTKYYLQRIAPCKSEEEPLCQLADFFVGLAVFSRNEFDVYKQWCIKNPEQPTLFSESIEAKFSNSQTERFLVMREFNKLCKNHRLGVALETKRGFETPNPNYPINFWLYRPQSDEDQAPLR